MLSKWIKRAFKAWFTRMAPRNSAMLLFTILKLSTMPEVKMLIVQKIFVLYMGTVLSKFNLIKEFFQRVYTLQSHVLSARSMYTYSALLHFIIMMVIGNKCSKITSIQLYKISSYNC